MGCSSGLLTGHTGAPDTFETVRAYIQVWLSGTRTDQLLLSAPDLKRTVVDDWAHQKDRYQIVSVRKPDDDRDAGHVPHAVNTYWADIVRDESLARLDPDKTLVLCCDYGHASMLSSTILSLLGYTCRSLSFGMMGWNLDALVKQPWDREADYEGELEVNRSRESYPPPVLTSTQTDARSVIREMATRYLAGEGSPVVSSSDVKAIVDDWEHRKVEYQIVDVRSKRDYEANHVPHAVNIPWARIAETRSLARLDPNRTAIVYSENGQTGQLATTVLSLLGYHAVAMRFGMMDWNKAFVRTSDRWAGAAGYPVERGS